MIKQFHFWVYNQKDEKQGLKQIFTHSFSGSIIHKAKGWKQHQVSIYEGVHTFNGALLSLKKKGDSGTVLQHG